MAIHESTAAGDEFSSAGTEDHDATEEAKLAVIERCIEESRKLLEDPLVSVKTQQEYHEMFQGYLEEKNVEYARSIVPLIKEMLSEAQQTKQHFAHHLETAVAQGWISRSAQQRWWDRFHDPHVLEWTRKQWIHEKFDGYMKGWKEVAEDRQRVLNEAEGKGIKLTGDPLLAQLKNHDSFLALDYDERKALVHRAQALIAALAHGKEAAYRQITAELQVAQRGAGRSLARGKAAQWLKETFATNDPEAYFAKVITPRMAAWEEMRQEFDALKREMPAKKVPAGFAVASLDQFLGWNLQQCETYLAEARSRLAEEERSSSEQERGLTEAIFTIRSAMDAKDWKGAQEQWEQCSKEYPKEQRLHSIGNYLQAHRDDQEPEKKEEPLSKDIQREMSKIIHELHPGLRHLYECALKRGSPTFRRLVDQMHYTQWLRHTEQLDREEAHEVMEYHDAQTEKTVVLSQEEGIAADRIVDGKKEEREETVPMPLFAKKEARMLTVGSDDASQKRAVEVLDRMDAHFEGSEYRGLLSEDPMASAQQEHLGEVNVRLLRCQEQLEKRGENFAMALAA